MNATITTTRRPARSRRSRTSPLIYVAALAAVIFAVTPILWALSTALKPAGQVLTSDPRWIPATVTFDNFAAVLRSNIPREILNTVIVSGATAIVTLAIAVAAAYATVRFKMRGRGLILFVILMTSMIPGIAVLLPLFYLSVRVGLYDSLAGLVVAFTAWQVPTTIWIMRGFISGIPEELEEAARVDGCTRTGAFFRIVLPLLRPGLAAAAMLIIIFVWNDFLLASSLISDTDLRLVNVGLYNYMSVYGIVWHELMAAVMVALVPVIVLFVLLERHLISGLAGGAVKG